MHNSEKQRKYAQGTVYIYSSNYKYDSEGYYDSEDYYDSEGYYDSGACVYSTPDGKEVIVTEVTEDITGAANMWDDKVFVGQVLNFIRKAYFIRKA